MRVTPDPTMVTIAPASVARASSAHPEIEVRVKPKSPTVVTRMNPTIVRHEANRSHQEQIPPGDRQEDGEQDSLEHLDRE